MQRDETRNHRFVALFIFGCLLFNYPLLSLFNVAADAFGIPLLYAYIFAAWGVLIVLLAATAEGRN